MREIRTITNERQLFIEVQTLEWLSLNRPEHLTLPKKPGYMEIVWLKKARGTCIIDLEKRTIREGEIYCIGSGQFRQINADKNIEGYYLSFAPALINVPFEDTQSLFEGRVKGPSGRVAIWEENEIKDDIEYLVRKIIKELSRPYEFNLEIVRGLLLLMISYLTRYVRQEVVESIACRK